MFMDGFKDGRSDTKVSSGWERPPTAYCWWENGDFY